MYGQQASRRMQQGAEFVAPRTRSRRGARTTSIAQIVCMSMLVCSLLLVGLVARAQQAPSKEQDQMMGQESGFLSNYSELQPDPNNSDLLVYWKSKDDLKTSNKFILDPVIVYLLPEAQKEGIDPAQLAKLAQYFTNAVKDSLTKPAGYELVTQPGPGVMVLRLAITNLAPNGGKENAGVKGAEIAATHAVAPGVSLLIPRVSVGKVSIEGEVVDSVSGDVMVSFMTSKSGRRYFSGLKAYEKWGDIDAAFRDWAKSLRQSLDKAHES